ncbi:FtsX-like permease family protein [Candidatus Marinimicrobia bacterium]|nr:FtsX-like permease family protein [Candidatus Neomarinimicrobiota bacterium]
MISFLFKGLLRDKSRSFFPIIIITLIVSIIIFFSGFLNGVYNSLFLNTAILNSGHVKVVTHAYNLEHQLLPNDLALLDANNLVEELENKYKEYTWTPRITFAGLLDVPDKNGETLSQSPVVGLGIDFLSDQSKQLDIWDLDKKIIKGSLFSNKNQILLSEKLSDRLQVYPGDIVTFIGATMYGGFTTYNFTVSGVFDLNLGPVDKDMMLVDFSGAQNILDMKDAASEILGYDNELFFNDNVTVEIRSEFNSQYSDSLDIYRPFMLALRDSNQMGTIVDFSNVIMSIILSLFLIVVTLVLWNMGIMSGLRRYGEIGMRLAIGETKGHVFKSMIAESVIIGFFGSIMGTTLGILLTSYLQEVGIDYSKAIDSLNSSNFAMPNIFYPQVTPDLFYIGFIPGILATVFGTMLAGRAIYKREMAQLFKELET